MMTPSKDLPRNWIVGGLAFALALTTFTPSAQANVYATNISVQVGTNVSISYILNEPASSGVTIKILSGSTAVRTMTITWGSAGTARGLNTVTWDGKDDSSVNVPAGNYSVSINAAAAGYSDWTQTSNDSDPGNYAYEPISIAVNQNTNSPYYGRVFVGNSDTAGGGALGDQLGILKLNADGSFADEGGFSTGGYAWGGAIFAPWKMEVSDDDKVYVNDWTGNGLIMSFDQVVSSGSLLNVLRDDNNPGNANMSGPFITGTGTDTQVWMADINYTVAGGSPAEGRGILRWNVTGDGTCALNDTGTQIVRTHFGSDLNIYPYDVAVDRSGRIYTVQYRSGSGDAAPRVLRFPAYPGTPETTADWKVGGGSSDMQNAMGIAVDPTATHVAVAFSVYTPYTGGGSGGVAILNAADGSLVTRSLAPLEDTTDVAWDKVGNLYVCDNYASLWRIYSPPGGNQATTVAVPTVQVTGSSLAPATITSIAPGTSGHYRISYSGGSGSQFVLLSSPTVNAPMNRWTCVDINNAASGTFSVSIGSGLFYRIKSE